MIADQIHALANKVSEARQFIGNTPKEVLTPRQLTGIDILYSQCQDFMAAYEANAEV